MTVLCVGQLVADVVVRPVDRLPVPGRTEGVANLELVAGGCAANTASVLAKLGVGVAVAGIVGSDSFGQAVLSNLCAAGVDTSPVVRHPDIPTSAVLVIADSRGERSFLYREGGNESLRESDISSEAIEQADFVHVGGAMKLLELDLESWLPRVRAAGCLTSLDTDWDTRGAWINHIGPALPYVNYLLTNEEEGQMLTGLEDCTDVGKRLLDMGPQLVVVKRGANGAVAVSDGRVRHFPAFPVAVLDTTCAGDGFAGGFLYGLTQDWDLDATMAFANATGALCTTTISHHGVSSVQDTLAFLRTHGIEVGRGPWKASDEKGLLVPAEQTR